MTFVQPPQNTRFPRPDGRAVGWATTSGLTGYLDAVEAMERHVDAMAVGEADELVWLLEHPPLYSAGVSAKAADLLSPHRFPVFRSGRGGQYTYHGPGQRVAYVMLDLRARDRDVKAFVRTLEGWIIDALADLGVRGETRPDRVGVWVADDGREDKIAAIGVKLRRWISFHGISINVAPDLDHFSGIVPCGIHDHGVTSLEHLGAAANIARTDLALRGAFERAFGPTCPATPPVVTRGPLG